jgi:hypothetical protein
LHRPGEFRDAIRDLVLDALGPLASMLDESRVLLFSEALEAFNQRWLIHG